ncbi:MAG: hypothetical protein ABTD50_06440 [Polyangiaceae bacterium]|jgi:hypothetical protein
MSNVSGTTATSNPYATSADPTLDAPSADPTASLTPDGLFTYCQSRLQSIDSQIQSGLDSQQTNNAELEQIGTVLANLKGLANGTTNGTQIVQAENALGTYINGLKSSDPTNPSIGTLTQIYNNMVWSGSGDPATFPGNNGPGYIDEATYPPEQNGPEGDMDYGDTEVQGYISSIQSVQDNMNSDSELTMINLQSLMSQRETAVQLTTNLMQSLDDQANKIVDNIGH